MSRSRPAERPCWTGALLSTSEKNCCNLSGF